VRIEKELIGTRGLTGEEILGQGTRVVSVDEETPNVCFSSFVQVVAKLGGCYGIDTEN
jgi:hypothetical protein